MHRKYLNFMSNEFFVFLVEAFQFYKFHENESKHNKRSPKTGLIVTFNIKNSQNYWKNRLKIWQAKYRNCLQMFLNTSEITKLDKILNSVMVYNLVLLLPLRKIN